jgi:transcriptional regulator with XRE-family HTH domain
MGQYHMSLGTLADYANCSKGFISHLLSGRRSSCTPLLAERIARSLHVPVEVLFEPKQSTNDMSVDTHKVPA